MFEVVLFLIKLFRCLSATRFRNDCLIKMFYHLPTPPPNWSWHFYSIVLSVLSFQLFHLCSFKILVFSSTKVTSWAHILCIIFFRRQNCNSRLCVCVHRSVKGNLTSAEWRRQRPRGGRKNRSQPRTRHKVRRLQTCHIARWNLKVSCSLGSF